jgi:hypothetical protein
MSYKCWRIVVAEVQHSRYHQIEKSLKELGYRASTRVHSLRELLGVTHYAHDPFEHFDLMIINGELLAMAGLDPVRFFQRNPQIRHGVIHDVRRGQPQAETIYATQRRQLCLIHSADRLSLGPLLEQLDV